MDEDEKITVACTQAFKRDLRIDAAKRGVSPSELVRHAVRRELKDPTPITPKRHRKSVA